MDDAIIISAQIIIAPNVNVAVLERLEGYAIVRLVFLAINFQVERKFVDIRNQVQSSIYTFSCYQFVKRSSHSTLFKTWIDVSRDNFCCFLINNKFSLVVQIKLGDLYCVNSRNSAIISAITAGCDAVNLPIISLTIHECTTAIEGGSSNAIDLNLII